MTPDERAAIAKRHRQSGHYRPRPYCAECGQNWPCDAKRLLDESGPFTKSAGSAVVIEAEDMR